MRWLALIFMLLSTAEAADQLFIFSRPECSPCQAMNAALAKDPTLVVGFQVFKVNTKERPDIAKRYGVTSVPVVVLVRENKEVRRRLGWTNADDLRAWLDDTKYRRRWR